jgi:hypothetical protein
MTMGRFNGGGWMLALALLAGVVVTPRLGGAMGALGEGFRDLARGPVAQAVDAQEGPEFRWSGDVAPGLAVEVKGVNGPIEAVPSQGDRVVVTARKTARRSDPDEVRIEVIEHAGGVTLCAVYPSERDRNRCAPGDGGRNDVRRNDVKVDFRVEVPAGVHFRAVTVNGGVRARELAGDVDATTVNGDIDVATSGFARARTVNGSITAAMDRWAGEDVSFTTVNGSIELDVPDDIDARVEGRWVNGGLESDLPLTLQGRMGRRSVSGVLGAGGAELRLKTVNGSIRIR